MPDRLTRQRRGEGEERAMREGEENDRERKRVPPQPPEAIQAAPRGVRVVEAEGGPPPSLNVKQGFTLISHFFGVLPREVSNLVADFTYFIFFHFSCQLHAIKPKKNAKQE